MLWTSIKRVIKGGVVNFYRNGFVSLASVLIMSVTLFAVGSVIFLSATLNSSLEEIKSKVDVNVYFLTSASEEDVLALATALRTLPEVKDVEYVSRAQALENFKKRHENDELTLQALSELPDNPLLPTLGVKAKEISQKERPRAGAVAVRRHRPVLEERQRPRGWQKGHHRRGELL